MFCRALCDHARDDLALPLVGYQWLVSWWVHSAAELRFPQLWCMGAEQRSCQTALNPCPGTDAPEEGGRKPCSEVV